MAKKETRVSVRITEQQKKDFYRVCELNGLCPSKLLERWINRFINNSKRNKIEFKEIYSAVTESTLEYEDYKKS